jgi:ERCC4-type nuclease
MLPETFGCDLLFAANGRWAGVQRKEFKDLISSIRDGRLGEQIAKMSDPGLCYRMVVVEGSAKWTMSGDLVGRYGGGVTRQSLRKILWTARANGLWVDFSDSLDDTVRLLETFEEWCKKDVHRSLSGRPAVRSQWGTVNSRDYQVHLLQGLPGVGPELAAKILDQVGMPMMLDPQSDLLSVSGLGPKRVAAITAVFKNSFLSNESGVQDE